MGFSLVRLTTTSGTLLAVHLFLAAIIVLGLHLSDISYDMKTSSDRKDMFTTGKDPSPCEKPKTLPEDKVCKSRLCCGSQKAKDLPTCPEVKEVEKDNGGGGKVKEYTCCNEWTQPENCTVYWEGMLWSVVVGLLGLCALAVFIANLFVVLPNLMWIYHLIAAILIFVVAALGLGINLLVDMYNICKEEEAIQKKIKASNPSYPVLHCFYGIGTGGGSMVYHNFLFALSCFLVFAHVMSFLIAFIAFRAAKAVSPTAYQQQQSQQSDPNAAPE